jgi:hypothetical protein
MLHRRVAVLMSLLLLLAACTDDEPDEPTAADSSSAPSSSSSSPPPSRSDAADPTDEETPADASFPADTADDGGPAEPGSESDPAGGVRVSGLRLNSTGGYARLVVDLSGSGVPEWSVGYSEATGPGGGPVEISGDAFLRVAVRTGAEPGGQSNTNIRTSPGPIVQARTTGSFEGYEEVLVGIEGGEKPFRAFALTDPGRIVIDVRPG